MGLRHKAKTGTTIAANGVKITVLRGSPLLDIAAPAEIAITIGKDQVSEPRQVAINLRRLKDRPRGGQPP
jgi:hypothetical protein